MVKWTVKLLCYAKITNILIKVYEVIPKYPISWISFHGDF
jgi:hypothetical protein